MSNHRGTVTYDEAKRTLLADLRSRGWAVSGPLKVPHATAPDGCVRFWFKPQAVHFTVGRGLHTLGEARCVSYDLDTRKTTADDLAGIAERLARQYR